MTDKEIRDAAVSIACVLVQIKRDAAAAEELDGICIAEEAFEIAGDLAVQARKWGYTGDIK